MNFVAMKKNEWTGKWLWSGKYICHIVSYDKRAPMMALRLDSVLDIDVNHSAGFAPTEIVMFNFACKKVR